MENMIVNEEAMENVNGGVARIDYDTGKYLFYTVVPGDCLSVIAARYGATTGIVYALNRQVIGPDMNLINPGMVLRIPVL